MQSHNNYFFGGLNTDDEDRLIPEGDYRAAYNARGNEAGESNKGALESMTGNLLVENTDLDDTQKVIGSAEWIENKAIIYFVCSLEPETTPHSIWYYETEAQTHTLILADNILNFQENFKIYRANVVNNILYWTDGWFESYLKDGDGVIQYNPPRMLNIANAIAGYTDVTVQLLDVIKQPIINPLEPVYVDTGNQTNLLYGDLLQFAARWVYENGEKSVWNVISKVPIPVKQEFVQGRNMLESALENAVEVIVPTGAEFIKYIQVAVRRGNIGQFGIFYDVDKTVEGIPSDDVVTVTYTGTEAVTPIALQEGLRNFDRVPQIAGVQEVLTSKQLSYGNIVEGYDGVDLGASEMSYLTTEIPYQVYGRNQMAYQKDDVVPPFTSPLKIYNIAPLQYFGYVEGDVIMFEFATQYDSITNTASNYITITYTVTVEDIETVYGIGTVAAQLIYMVNTVGEYVSDELISRGFPNTFTPTVSPAIACEIDFTSSAIVYGMDSEKRVTNLAKNAPIKSLKTGAIHEFGIQYYDRAMRSGGVLTRDNYKVFVPFPTDEPSRVDFLNESSPYFVRPYITGKHTPPEWAYYYQILWRKTAIADFQQRTVIKLEAVPSTLTYKMSLDTYYEETWGAKINHTIQVGDIVRVKNAKGEFVSDAETGLQTYANGYVEMQVVKYEEGGGINGAEAIYVQLFDYNTIVGATDSFVIEIFSLREQSLEEPFNEIGELYDIIDPKTEDRRHGGQTYSGGVVTSPTVGGDTFVVQGDVRPLLLGFGGSSYEITFTPTVGTPFVTTASAITYNYATNKSTITTVDTSDGTTYATYTFTTDEATTSSFTCYLDFGNVYVRPRITNRYPVSLQGNFDWRYYVEDPYVSDYYVSNSIDIGKIGIIDKLGGRKQLRASIIHGGAYIDNTNNNNLCSFDFNPLNKVDLDEQYGTIRYLIMNGYTLKSLQDRKETSIYIQRTMAVGANNSQNVAFTDRTFGGVNPYETDFGTIYPASVKILGGDMYYYDYYSSRFIRSRTNGQQELSQDKFKINAFTTELTNRIRVAGTGNFEVIGALDEQNREYQCYFRELNSEEPYEIGIYFAMDEDRWKSYVTFVPTWADNLGNVSVLFKDAQTYVQNEGVNLEFFGEAKEFNVEYVYAAEANLPKQPLAHGVRCYPSPDELVCSIPTYGSYTAMRTTMPSYLFRVLENGYWAQYQKDELDPTFATEELARLNGRVLRGYLLRHRLTFSGETKIVLFSTITNYIPSPSIL